jgi:hypothetical protein
MRKEEYRFNMRLKTLNVKVFLELVLILKNNIVKHVHPEQVPHIV